MRSFGRGCLPGDHGTALRTLESLWAQINVVEVDETLATRAATMARELGLRGYDAVHCASAEQLNDDDVVAAGGDQRLLPAWAEIGVATYDTNGTHGHEAG